MNDDPVILYLLMRHDLTSLNPGKACAQAHHAATLMSSHVPAVLPGLYMEWLSQTGLFGTVIVLGADEGDILTAMQCAEVLGLIHGKVIDPTYPIKDGWVTHKIPLLTCGYILARQSVTDFLNDLSLMP